MHSGLRASRTERVDQLAFRLCGGMFVAMPTAIPGEPLASRFGKRAGSTTGSVTEPSKLGGEVDRLAVDVAQHLLGELR